MNQDRETDEVKMLREEVLYLRQELMRLGVKAVNVAHDKLIPPPFKHLDQEEEHA